MRKRFRGNAPLSTGRYDTELEKLSSGNFNPSEEQSKLRSTGASTDHASGVNPTLQQKNN